MIVFFEYNHFFSRLSCEFKELYAKRWGVETYFNIIKNRLSLENFTGLTSLAIKQDIFSTLFLSNYESFLVFSLNFVLKEKSSKNKYIQKVNKSISFNAIKLKAFELFYSDKNIDELLDKLYELFLTNLVLIKPNRQNEREKTKKGNRKSFEKSARFLKRKKKHIGN